MVSFCLYGLYETLSVAFRHVAKQCLKSSENVKNREFSLASVMFKVTFKYDSRVSENDEHCFIRLFDELNHVVGSIFGGRCRKHPLLQANEMLRNTPKCSEMC